MIWGLLNLLKALPLLGFVNEKIIMNGGFLMFSLLYVCERLRAVKVGVD
jgi:hypothetical protein